VRGGREGDDATPRLEAVCMVRVYTAGRRTIHPIAIIIVPRIPAAPSEEARRVRGADQDYRHGGRRGYVHDGAQGLDVVGQPFLGGPAFCWCVLGLGERGPSGHVSRAVCGRGAPCAGIPAGFSWQHTMRNIANSQVSKLYGLPMMHALMHAEELWG
jgi:hypothetical protein